VIVGVPVHVPFVPLSVWPSVVVPEIAGSTVLTALPRRSPLSARSWLVYCRPRWWPSPPVEPSTYIGRGQEVGRRGRARDVGTGPPLPLQRRHW